MKKLLIMLVMSWLIVIGSYTNWRIKQLRVYYPNLGYWKAFWMFIP